MDDNEDKSQLALDLATSILEELERMKCDPAISYAVLGGAFSRMHVGLGKGKEEWLEITKEMATYL